MTNLRSNALIDAAIVKHYELATTVDVARLRLDAMLILDAKAKQAPATKQPCNEKRGWYGFKPGCSRKKTEAGNQTETPTKNQGEKKSLQDTVEKVKARLKTKGINPSTIPSEKIEAKILENPKAADKIKEESPAKKISQETPRSSAVDGDRDKKRVDLFKATGIPIDRQEFYRDSVNKVLEHVKKTGFKGDLSGLKGVTDLDEKDIEKAKEFIQLKKDNAKKIFTEDGEEAKISPSVSAKLVGNRVVSKMELDQIGVSNHDEIDDDRIESLNMIRNGFPSVESFLESPPNILKDGFQAKPEPGVIINNSQKIDRGVVVFAGKRVVMEITPDGGVEFAVDGAYSTNDKEGDSAPPTSELKAMTKAWNRFIESPAGKRKFYTIPTTDDEVGQTRVKLYQKRGFVATTGDIDTAKQGGKVVMELDNRGEK